MFLRPWGGVAGGARIVPLLVLRGGLFELPETERTPRKKNAGRQKGGLLNEAALASAGDPLMALLMGAGMEEDPVASTPLPKDFKIRVRAVANGYGSRPGGNPGANGWLL